MMKVKVERQEWKGVRSHPRVLWIVCVLFVSFIQVHCGAFWEVESWTWWTLLWWTVNALIFFHPFDFFLHFCLVWGLQVGSLLIITIFLRSHVFRYMKTVHFSVLGLCALLDSKGFKYYYSLDLFGLIINGAYQFHPKTDEFQWNITTSQEGITSVQLCLNCT